MRENVFDQASELRTDGAAARYDDARASGTDIEARLTQVRDAAHPEQPAAGKVRLMARQTGGEVKIIISDELLGR